MVLQCCSSSDASPHRYTVISLQEHKLVAAGKAELQGNAERLRTAEGDSAACLDCCYTMVQTALSETGCAGTGLTLTLMTVIEPAMEQMPTYTKMLVVPCVGAATKIRKRVNVRAATAYSRKPAPSCDQQRPSPAGHACFP